MTDTDDLFGQALHEEYLNERLARGEMLGATPSLRYWEALSEEFRKSSRRNARDIREAIAEYGYVIREAGTGTKVDRLDDEEVERVAERIHARWLDERTLSGWRPGAARNDDARLHPDLVSWDDLPEERREIDRHLVRELPDILARAGLELAKASTQTL